VIVITPTPHVDVQAWSLDDHRDLARRKHLNDRGDLRRHSLPNLRTSRDTVDNPGELGTPDHALGR
jgi:hypothetical protein